MPAWKQFEDFGIGAQAMKKTYARLEAAQVG